MYENLNGVRYYRPQMMAAAHDNSGAPEGFAPMAPFGPYHELVGPIYYSLAQPATVIGLRIAQKHRNRSSVPMMHGGMVAMLIDTACTWAAKHSRDPPLSLLTTNLSINLVGNAGPGEWVEVHVDIVKSGRRIVFADCFCWCRGQRIAQASAQLAVMGEAPPDAPTYLRSTNLKETS